MPTAAPVVNQPVSPSWWDQLLQSIFPAEQGGMTFPASTEATAAAAARERDAARIQLEQAAAAAVAGKGAKRKPAAGQDEQRLQDLLNTPRGQNYGR